MKEEKQEGEKRRKTISVTVTREGEERLFAKTYRLSLFWWSAAGVLLLLILLVLILVLYTPFLRKTNLVGSRGLVRSHVFVENVLGTSPKEYDEALWNYYTRYGQDEFISREQLLQSILRLDSMETELTLWRDYARNIEAIMAGDKPAVRVDSLRIAATGGGASAPVARSMQDSLLRSRVEAFEAQRDAAARQTGSYNMHAPLSGIITLPFDPAKGNRGIRIEPVTSQPVLAVGNGTVTLVTWNVEDGWVMQIQHANNMVSSYKHLSEVLKKEGDRLLAGEAVGYVGSEEAPEGQTSRPNDLYFELWYNGNAVNPENYILF